jgi:hypothetical protein
MKKTIFTTIMITATVGAALFANGNNEAPAHGGQNGNNGVFGENGVEIVDLEGTVEKDSYGNLMIDEGKTNYLLAPTPTLRVDLQEGNIVEGEGFEGNTIYTKDGESYVNFHFTMVTVDGEEYVIDMNKLTKGGRGDRHEGSEETMGGSMHEENGDDKSHGGRGGFSIPDDAEEISLTGSIVLVEDHPVLETADGSYLIKMGRMSRDVLTEGATVEATGYVSPSLHNEDGKDYYDFMATSLTIDGEVVEVDFPMNGKGRDGEGRMGHDN